METNNKSISQKIIKTRFAPAPSGTIHLGNIRTALLNLIFAHQNSGRCLLRIEDTDKEKVTQKSIEQLFIDLNWLNIFYDEDPFKEGQDKPYFQSERQSFYEAGLQKLIELKKAYPCFCSKGRLEELRQQQAAKKIAPRYDRLCLNLPDEIIKHKISLRETFVWRFLIDHEEKIEITDLIRGKISFEMKNFSDFVISRSDSSFNFLFANFIDDIEMNITHIIRGEDHLSNGALQASLYNLFKKTTPIFIHLALILDEQGQKLSKSNKNFDLEFLKESGFLPEAICNYLVCLGSNLDNKPKSISQIIKEFNFSSLSCQAVKYEIKKIKELNKKWIAALSAKELLQKMHAQLTPEILNKIQECDETKLLRAIDACKNSFETLLEVLELSIILSKERLEINDEILQASKNVYSGKVKLFFESNKFEAVESLESFQALCDAGIKEHNISKKELFTFIRLACTGQEHGLSINEIFLFFGGKAIQLRIVELMIFLK